MMSCRGIGILKLRKHKVSEANLHFYDSDFIVPSSIFHAIFLSDQRICCRRK